MPPVNKPSYDDPTAWEYEHTACNEPCDQLQTVAHRQVDGPVKRVATFIDTYLSYRRQHSRRYAFSIAFGCAFRGLPF